MKGKEMTVPLTLTPNWSKLPGTTYLRVLQRTGIYHLHCVKVQPTGGAGTIINIKSDIAEN